ncbi:MAG: hypothetical protein IJM62_00185 [Lachnospiraceae bacterium]|nr:hypothetical protein [Lachnospiraceae bacterium]
MEFSDDNNFCPYCGVKADPESLAPQQAEPEELREETSPGYDAVSPYRDAAGSQPELPVETPGKKAAVSASWKWSAILLMIALAVVTGLFIYDHSNNTVRIRELEFNYRQLQTSYQNIQSQYDSLYNNTSAISEELDTVKWERDEAQQQITRLQQEKDAAVQEKENAQEGNSRFEEIISWAASHRKEYNSSSNYYAGSNTIVVKAGETAKLKITRKEKNWGWVKYENSSVCTAEWTKEWDGSVTEVNVKGVSAGITELVFSESKDENSTQTERFRVLVIVY